MNGLFVAAQEIQQFMQARNWQFCVIGGLAVIRWGQARTTQDIDISLLTGLGSEEEYIDELLPTFAGRIPDAREFALQSRVLLIQASNGVPLDIALAAFPFEEQVISRASVFEFAPGTPIITASAEDLVVLKALAGRNQDWADIEGIARRQAGRLDWDYLLTTFRSLAELQGATESESRLEAIRQSAMK